MDKQIANPRVLFVQFFEQEGSWVAVIPHAFGKDKHFELPISEKVSLQFQPVTMNNMLRSTSVTGVGCVPLIEVTEEETDGETRTT